MSTLERFHLVQRRSIAGEGKRAFFEAEADFWYIFQQFLDQQVRREIEMMSRSLDTAELALEGADDAQAEADAEKIRELQAMYDRSERMVDLVTSERLDRLASLLERLRGSDS
jgi:DNA-binding transcriptional regulator GbsR (MarR family)